jgi:hypothetical protein
MWEGIEQQPFDKLRTGWQLAVSKLGNEGMRTLVKQISY